MINVKANREGGLGHPLSKETQNAQHAAACRGVAGIVDYPPDELVHGETPGGVDGSYKYALYETLAGPSQQWELLGQAMVEDYETQEAKAKRVKMEKIKGDCEARVAHEATLGAQG